MKNRKLRSRMAVAGSLSVTAVMVAMTLGVTAASAQTVGTGNPRWFIGAPQSIRDAGSDTTFFMMQRISDLFEDSGLFGCTLSLTGGSSDYSTCNTGADADTTDLTDNYDRIEIGTGIDQIGSGEGQNQLCGVDTSPFPVDFSRSSKPAGSACTDMVGLGYAKDGVPAVDFPGAEGPGTATGTLYYNKTTCVSGCAFPSGYTGLGGKIIGPVASGWLPGDSVTCDLTSSCSGTPLTDLDNTGGTSSVAYRLFCATDSSRITDWGQLTNLAGGKAVGNGTAIGIPINVIGVNTSSGTESTFAGFVGCSTTDVNATPLAPAQNIENNAAQIGDIAAGDYPSADSTQAADQAALVATSVYYMSDGVYDSNIHSRTITLSNGTLYAAVKTSLNGITATKSPSGTLMNNTFPTARTLFNIYRTGTLRASVADFLNWICDNNSVFQKGKDLNTGLNYNTELTSAVNGTFGFIRLTDQTAAPNNSCQLINVAPAVTDAALTPDGSSSTETDVHSAQGFAQAGQTPVQTGNLVTSSVFTSAENPVYVAKVLDANDIVLVTHDGNQVTASGQTLTFNIHAPNS